MKSSESSKSIVSKSYEFILATGNIKNLVNYASYISFENGFGFYFFLLSS